ncbi:MAG: cytochrome P450 [Ktedonobacterales bacterium]|nr:cytochrome P450 [Ktedonobacterales bacterium]
MIPEATVQPFAAIPEVVVPDAHRKNPVAYLLGAAVTAGPIFRRRTGHRQVGRYGPWQVYLVGPAANRFVLHTHRHLFAHAPGWRAFFGGMWNENLLYLDGDVHAAHRRIMTPAFTTGHLDGYLAVMHHVVAERTRDWATRGSVEIRAEMRDLAFDVVARALLGFAPPARVVALHHLRDAVARNPYPYGKAGYWAHITAQRAAFNAAISAAVATRVGGDDDLLAAMTAARDASGGELDEEHFLGHIQVLLEAGHTTTMDTAMWALGLLATHPAYLERARTEVAEVAGAHGGDLSLAALRAMPVLGRAIDEAGRLRTPVDTAPRGTTAAVAFAGYEIAPGTFVRLHLGATHRLPVVFDHPERFDPDRFAPPRQEDRRTPYGLVTFGGGPRICIGMQFAQIEIKALLAHLLLRFDIMPIPGVTPANVYDPAILDDSLPQGLPLRFTAR